MMLFFRGPLVEEFQHLFRIMVGAFFQCSGVLGGQLLAVGIEDHDDRESVAGGVSVFGVGRLVVALVHVDQHDHIVGPQLGRDGRVFLEEFVKLVTPAAPVGPKLKQDALVLFFGDDQGLADLCGAIQGFIVDGGLVRLFILSVNGLVKDRGA